MPVLRAVRADNRLEDVLDAAARLFAAKGYSATSMRDIAQAEGRWRAAFDASPGAGKRVVKRSGIEIQPLYRPAHGSEGNYLETLGFPGE